MSIVTTNYQEEIRKVRIQSHLAHQYNINVTVSDVFPHPDFADRVVVLCTLGTQECKMEMTMRDFNSAVECGPDAPDAIEIRELEQEALEQELEEEYGKK